MEDHEQKYIYKDRSFTSQGSSYEVGILKYRGIFGANKVLVGFKDINPEIRVNQEGMVENCILLSHR